MEVIVKIDKRNRQAEILLEMLKTFDFVKFMSYENEEPAIPCAKEQFIEDISKQIKRAGTKKAFADLGLDYDSYSR